MISNYSSILYYSPKSRIPTIIRPINNKFWTTDRTNVLFAWIHNSFDLQLEYQIQVYSFNVKQQAIPDEWEQLIEEGNDDVSPFVGSPVVDISEITTAQFKYIDFSSIAPFNDVDGQYLFRLKTRGNVASEWSDWNTDGRLNLDAVNPKIRNVCIESPSSFDENNKPNMASFISDLSMPFISSERIVGLGTVEDRHIDRQETDGLFVYYDYRDNAIVLRAQKGGATTNPRFYGMISFHGTENNIVPDFSIQSAIKSSYLYKINKGHLEGPFEQTRFEDESNGFFVGDTIEKIIYKDDFGSTVNDFIPKGFPKFWQGGIYGGASDHEKYPAGMDRNISFFSVFPFSTKVVTRTLTFPLAGPTGFDQTQTFTDAIELTYPVPYNDLFILFDGAMSNILAYGQYRDTDLSATKDSGGSFVLLRGLDVESWRASGQSLPNPKDEPKHQFFNVTGTVSNPPTLGELRRDPVLRGAFPQFSTDQIDNGQIRSHYLFYNLTADDDNDNAFKIYLRPKALTFSENGAIDKIDEQDSVLSSQISFIDFQMSPETDCVFAGTSPTGNPINISKVFIGKGKISPKALSYAERNPQDKQFLTNPKIAPIPFKNEGNLTQANNSLWTMANRWGVEQDDENFSHNPDSYNASFRIKIPLYKYVPYYHPGSVNYSNTPTNPQPPVPYIFDANPDQDVNYVIGWDTITMETKDDSSFVNEALPQSDVIYRGDFIRFMGTTRAMGQINPFLYNFEKWSEPGIAQGTILRVRDDGVFQPFMLKPEDYFFFGKTMFEDGWFYDGTHFNGVDKGLYSIGDLLRNKTSTNSDIYIINFSSYLFRRSIEAANKSVFLSADEYTDDLFAIDDNIPNPNSTLLDETVLEAASSTNGPSFIYRITIDNDFQNALITGDDLSAQGHYGRTGSIDDRWLEDESNSYGGYYLIERISDFDTANQIKRIITIGGSDFNYTTMSPVDRFDIDITPVSGKSTRITGDNFSMGNIFGNIIPNEDNKVKLFFDFKEINAGIENIKIFQVDLETAPINFGDTNLNVIDSAQYIGPLNTGNDDTKIGILMQKINNRQFDLNIPSTVTNALAIIKTSRSPLSLMEYYFDNNITLWESAETSERTIIDASSGTPTEKTIEYTSDQAGYFHEITVVGTGLKLLFIQAQDRSGNISDIYSVPVFIPAASTIQQTNSIKSAVTSADDGQVIRTTTTATIYGNDFNFVEHLLTVDVDKSRSIMIKKLIIEDLEDPGNYRAVENVNDLLAGFSDNYGLSYNLYSPLSSITSWRFTRPFSIRIKSLDENLRKKEPMWYFDPNHVRHYKTDTDADFILLSQNDKIQSNNSVSNVTLFGFQLSSSGSVNDTNPVADILYKFKEEFIGKTIKLGNIMDRSFTILNIFKKSLNSVLKTAEPNSQAVHSSGTKTIDGSTEKVWVVIEDPDALGAMIASRKMQYARSNSNQANFDRFKKHTFKNNSTDFSGSVYTQVFGYEPVEANIDDAINELVNDALKMNGNVIATNGNPNTSPIINTPGNAGDFSEGELSIFFIPNSALNASSGVPTDEGWTTQLFQAFNVNENDEIIESSGLTILNNLTQRQLIGLKVYNRFVFGERLSLKADIDSTSIFSVPLGGSLLLLDGDPFDETMVSMAYKIRNKTIDVFLEINNPQIKRVEIEGQSVVVEDDIIGLMNFSLYEYEFIVEIDPLDSIDPASEENLIDGWWPSIEGLVVPPLGNRLGTVGLSNTSARENVDFAVVSNGSFYVPENGHYTFKLEIDSSLGTYADLNIDFLRNSFGEEITTTVKDIIDFGGVFVEEDVGGFFSTNLANPEKTYYLTKGWHIGRFRYVAKDQSNTNSASILYSKASWDDSSLKAPMVGDNSSKYSFLSRSYRSIFCKIRNQQFEQIYPDLSASSISASQFCRTVLGFIRELTDVSSSNTVNQVALIERNPLEPDFGERISTTLPEASPTFGGQKFEEVYAIYISNIFDTGLDFRFYRTISWTPLPTSLPAGTSVEFEIRTGSTEDELLSREFNTIIANDETITFEPFTSPGADIIRFSHTGAGDDPDDIKLNRFIQFKMTLRSRIRDVTPQVDDVTIAYSKSNSVNFFTTSFNLQSRLLRGILTYNGEKPVDPSGIALTDIQFGISTEEVSDGIVSTNFSDYKIINPNEVFSLSQIGVPEGKNFRVGIRLISSSEKVPVVDEFAIMFSTDGNSEQLNKVA